MTETKKKKKSCANTAKAQQTYDKLRGENYTPLFYNRQFYLYHPDWGRYVEYRDLPQYVRKFLRDAKQPQSNNIVGNIVPIIHNLAYRSHDVLGDLPFYIGDVKFPEPKNIIAYKNGLLDIESGELKSHTPDWVSLNCLPYDYDPAATCPNWLHFLGEVFEGDDKKANLLQEWFGYCLTQDTSRQKCMFLVGQTRSGKGTTSRTLQALLGESNWVAFTPYNLITTFGLRRLVGKQAGFCGELHLEGSRDKPRMVEVMLGIVGEDPQPIENKHDNSSPTIKLPTRLTFSCNELSKFIDPSGALAARSLILPYRKSWANNPDETLGERLLTELPGIANWALIGLQRLKATGWTTPDDMPAMVNDYRRANSPAFSFVQDCLEVSASCDTGCLDGVTIVDDDCEVRSTELIEAYGHWSDDNHIEHRPAFNNFMRDIQSSVIPKLRKGTQKRVPGDMYKKYFPYYGIRLKPEPVDPPVVAPVASKLEPEPEAEIPEAEFLAGLNNLKGK